LSLAVEGLSSSSVSKLENHVIVMGYDVLGIYAVESSRRWVFLA
jgi:hypothetical protein